MVGGPRTPEPRDEQKGRHMDKTYTVVGMTCDHCVNAVTSEVGAIDGVDGVVVDLASGAVRVSGEGFTDQQVAAAVDEAGYALAG